ncbi:hypothetical protein [Sphingomonas solaris]|uniref:Uncharacterized protein n=1 Tax=Alterirhizorhabdus solaris TaxID=2529389 RepID=A0A558R3Y4_9SPHN|nr:hypothetical protein [Sphingomonas solaris]TVV74057.1 hypothetical protein FOY91_10900 [Sphingomonas solaris]
MAETPTDPLALIQTLVSAWNKGITETSAKPAVPTMPATPDGGHAEIVARLTLVEERLLRIEALLVTAAAERAARPKRVRKT